METVPTSTCFSLSQSVDGRLQKLNTWSRTGRLLSPSPDVTTQPLCGTNESCTPIAGRPEAVLSFCRGCLMVGMSVNGWSKVLLIKTYGSGDIMIGVLRFSRSSSTDDRNTIRRRPTSRFKVSGHFQITPISCVSDRQPLLLTNIYFEQLGLRSG